MTVDVCVVGGGPAGAGLAAELARLGHTVAVVEQRVFPRDHVGESLSPGAWPLLDSLGVHRAAVESVGLPVSAASVRWRSADQERRPVEGLTVDRGRFDDLLLDHARSAGAAVHTGRARRPRRTASGWRVPLDAGCVEASVLADASGRHAVLGGHRIRTSPRTVAVHARWRVDEPAAGPQTLILSLPDGWLWYARLPGDQVRVMIVVDSELLGQEQVEPERLLRRLLAAEEGAVRLVESMPQGTVVEVCDAGCYHFADVVSLDSVRVGEAAFAIDPLSSSGIQTAIQTGLAAAATIHTVLTPGGDQAAALEYYADLVRASVTHHRRTTGRLYAEHREYADRPFWQRRSTAPRAPAADATRFGLAQLLPRPVRLRTLAEIRDTPCRVGDRIERRPAVCAPWLDRPVGFLGGVWLGGLIKGLEAAPSLGAALSQWDRWLPAGRPGMIISWLLDHHLLEPSGSPDRVSHGTPATFTSPRVPKNAADQSVTT